MGFMDADVECEYARIEAGRDGEDTLLITVSGSWCILANLDRSMTEIMCLA